MEICSMRYMIETERSDLFDVSIVIAMRVHMKRILNGARNQRSY